MRNLATTLAWMLAAGTVACGSPEQSTVDQFFRAAQSGDRTTVAAMSSASPPGEVESWDVVEVTSRTSVPYALPELQRRLAKARKSRDDQLEEGRNYLVGHREALDQIIPKLNEDSSYRFDGELGVVQQEWSALVDERKLKEGAYQDLNRAIEAELKNADKSIMSEVDLEFLYGDIAVTEVLVTIQAPGAEPEPYTVTLRKYDLARSEDARNEPSRWIIVDIEERPRT